MKNHLIQLRSTNLELANNSQPSYEVPEMEHSDFYNFKPKQTP